MLNDFLKTSEYELVRSAQQGCIEDFGCLYQQYYKAIVSIAFSLLGDMHMAEDIAQETFAIACGDIVRLRHPEKFSAWISGICRNLAKKSLRANRNNRLNQDCMKIIAESNSDVPDYETLDCIRQAVWELPLNSREVIILRYFNAMSYEEISKISGLSVQGINGRIFRAKKKIVAYLKKRGITV